MPRYIDAGALKAKYEQMLPEIGDGYHKETLQDVLFELEYAPTVSHDEVRGEGKWIPLNYSGEAYGNMYKCAKCGCSEIGDPSYCPNCGAKMEVDRWLTF